MKGGKLKLLSNLSASHPDNGYRNDGQYGDKFSHD
jgi:hypothetical protein